MGTEQQLKHYKRRTEWKINRKHRRHSVIHGLTYGLLSVLPQLRFYSNCSCEGMDSIDNVRATLALAELGTKYIH